MIEIIQLEKISQEIVEAFARLIPQLIPEAETPSFEYLESILASGQTKIFIAKEGEEILGTLSLVVYQIPAGKRAWVEDVVVDKDTRGKGIARLLVEKALSTAKKEKISKIDLTSGQARKPAHALYRSTGFKERDTLVFRYQPK